MNLSLVSGLSFGLTSGVITTLGLMVGLHSGTHSKLAVVGGIITIAIADALSDALGMHVSQEAQNRYSVKEVWLATVVTFFTKFFMAASFLVPIGLFDLDAAIVASVAWGLLVLTVLSYALAKRENARPLAVIAEHLGVAIVVIAITHYVGDWVGLVFQ